MTTPISPIRLPELSRVDRPASKGAGFGSVLEGAIEQVDQFQKDAAGKLNQFLSGESEDLHSTILA
ncbi:MAG: flagellar hook-basal body complex protein FliE, partial [Bryobacteraceae bacterium]